MTWFHYGYSPHPQSRRGCSLWANDYTQGVKLAELLRFDFDGVSNGKILEMRASRLIQLPGGLTRPDVLHALCFMTFLANRVHVNPNLLLGDDGPLHTLAHARHFGGVAPAIHTDRVITQILWLEQVTPGLPPAYVVLDPSEDDDDRGVPGVAIDANRITQCSRNLLWSE